MNVMFLYRKNSNAFISIINQEYNNYKTIGLAVGTWFVIDTIVSNYYKTIKNELSIFI